MMGDLAACYQLLQRDKACGLDGETVASYGGNLSANLSRLVASRQGKRYRPKSVGRVLIRQPGKVAKRTLGIISVADKLVPMVLQQILEKIYEANLKDCAYGF
jgi:RNA-directed DNA polymerase